MKIRKAAKENAASPGVREGRQSVNRVQPSFGDQMHRIQSDLIHEKLERLFNDIDEQGKILRESLNLKDLKKYKGLIQKFLDYAVNKMYRLKEQTGWDRKGRHKIYTLVETVNKGLEELTTMLMAEQKDQIAILAKVDEIRGLLIDVYS